jgi:tetratricopeptide (TPR) repeat protein
VADSARLLCAFVVLTAYADGVGLRAQPLFTLAQEQQFHEQATAVLAHGTHDEATVLVSTRPAEDPSAVALRARLLVLRGQYGAAEALISSIAEANPTTAAGLEFALLLTRTGRFEEAVRYFQAVIDAAADSRVGLDLYRGGLAAQALGRYLDANDFFRDAAVASPSDPAVQTAWAELFLEKYNRTDAVRSFQEALTLDDKWAPALLGIARSLVNENPQDARASAERALELSPTFVAAYLFLAEEELGDRNVDGARALVERALEINPASLESRALVAAMAYLDDRIDDFEAEVARALDINPAYGDIYRIVGSHAARAYRFDEAVVLVRRAVELDPNNPRSYAELGMHLLRTGDERGAREALDRSFADDPFDLITFNLLNMMDTLDEFQTFERGDVILRLHRDEAAVLSEYVLTLAQEALDELSARYRMDVDGPILIEVFPRHDDFAVRNLGLPGMVGALGACFGRVVTMDSPRALPPGGFNWRSTLWHEIAHVITLQMSGNRLPRWLSEGISTYEEKRKRLEWGRDQVLDFASALNNDAVLPLRDLNSGFSHSETISMSYFQASVLVEHIVDTHGEQALQVLVGAYADGVETDEALARIGVSFDTLQASFDEAVEREFGDLRRALRPPEGGMPDAGLEDSLAELGRLAAEHPESYPAQYAYGMALRVGGELRDALEVLDRAARLAPQATGMESPRGVMAGIAQELGDRDRAMQELERLLEYDATSIEAARDLAALAEEAGDQPRMLLAYDRVIGIDPFDPVSHQAVGRMALARGEVDQAILEFQVALAVGPVDLVGVYCDLAESLLLAGQLDAAKRQALSALEIAPTYERAQELLLRAVEEQP